MNILRFSDLCAQGLVRGKRVFIRADLNVPQDDAGNITEDTRIRASTKRDVTERFLRSIDDELQLRRNNPALRAAAGDSLARVFLELARHRLPGSIFDFLLQEALAACGPEAAAAEIRRFFRAEEVFAPSAVRI